MKKAKKWQIISHETISATSRQDTLLEILLQNRGISTKEEMEDFLHPILEKVTAENVGIDSKQITKTLTRLKKAIEQKEKIVVFGDYDVDGITGTAILWETLHSLQAKVIPYIPNRIDEGYGLSIKGIENVVASHPDVKIIVTVDNGIVANAAVDFANEKNIEVIITDHHTVGEKLPNAFSIVHTTKVCGAAVAWILMQELKEKKDTMHLDLVALATVADLVPLIGANRILLTEGLKHLRKTSRPGLLALFQEAIIDASMITPYHIGHIIGPRLNAMGRMESAMDSLRLLCTKDNNRAAMLASVLGSTNKDRQLITQNSSLHAIEQFRNKKIKNILFIANKTYEEGVIGLIAGKLVEEYYRPAIVISIGEKVSKASARSVSGFNIIEFIRTSQELLLNAGGHPMAAGFTIETEKISLLQERLEKSIDQYLTEEILTATLKIDTETPFSIITKKLYDAIQTLAPFGMKNPEPVFLTKNVVVQDNRVLGQGKHLKLVVSDSDGSHPIDAIAFSMGEREQEARKGKVLDIVYTIDENEWKGNKKLQLKIKDFQVGTNLSAKN